MQAIAEIVDLTKAMMRFRSTHDRPSEIARCADFIEQYLKRHAIAYRRLDINGVPSIAALPAENQARVLLMSHFDVVDAPDALFEPLEKNHRLYGRGSIDDKYAVALSLVLLKEQLNHLNSAGAPKSDLPLGILMTGDEEVGGFNGAQAVLEGLQVDFCIALDGGSLDRIIVREKGVARLKLESRGRPAHAARPWLGVNAVDVLIEDYQRMKTFFDLQSGPDHWHRTLNISTVRAGGSINQVPGTAEACFDVRYTETDDMPSLFEQMAAMVSGRLSLEMLEPVFEGGESPYRDRLLKQVVNTRLDVEHGASDARFLGRWGIPGVVWGASGDLSQHSDDEHLNLDSVGPLFHALWSFCDDLRRSAPACP